MKISLTVDGSEYTDDVEPRTLLVHYLRQSLGKTGTNVGCDTSNCGACTVLLDGRSAKSCTVLAAQADGCEVTTIEGMASNPDDPEGGWHPLQRNFYKLHGMQCGYCTPGMIMAASDLLTENPNASEIEIRESIEGNLCRCTGYQNIVRAIMAASREVADAPTNTPEVST